MAHEINPMAVLPEDTYFAPAGRSDVHRIQQLNALIESAPYVKNLINAMPFVVLILNTDRQIVAANDKTYRLLGINLAEALGRRPGELIGCIHAGDGPNGCGTERHCKVCGAVNAILDTINTANRVTEECRITLYDGNALDWEVTTSLLNIEGQPFICMGIQDISHQKRRSALERTFFHDTINHIGAIAGFIQMLAEEIPDSEELKEVIKLSNELLEDVQSQRDLSLAENGDLVPTIESVCLQSFLGRLAQLYQSHPAAQNRSIVVKSIGQQVIRTDVRLLKRVIGNMLKNAIEASSDEQTVTVSCSCMDGFVSVHVHNCGVIPEQIQYEIFNRSFSTKTGSGRGIGTYSMKLLGETYLNGHVSFESSEETGPTCTITLPMHTNPQL